MKRYLVEIRVKDWVVLPDGARVLGYEEVEAYNEYGARHLGFDQFAARKTNTRGLEPKDYCAPDAVCLDD